MDWKTEISRRIEALPPDLQRRVHEYVSALSSEGSAGEPGETVRASAGVLDEVSAREMILAIEAECERIDAGQW